MIEVLMWLGIIVGCLLAIALLPYAIGVLAGLLIVGFYLLIICVATIGALFLMLAEVVGEIASYLWGALTDPFRSKKIVETNEDWTDD